MYACGPTVYARAHIGNFRTYVCLDVLRRTLKYVCGLRGAPGGQLHRRRRQDDRRRAGGRRAASRVHRAVDSRVPRRRGAAGDRGAGGDAARHRRGEPARDGRHDSRARAQRPHLSARRLDLFPDRDASRSTAGWRRLDREGMQDGASVDVDEYSKDDPRDFVLWKGDASGRAVVGLRHRPRPSRAGTSSARRWRCGCSASRRSTSTPAAST